MRAWKLWKELHEYLRVDCSGGTVRTAGRAPPPDEPHAFPSSGRSAQIPLLKGHRVLFIRGPPFNNAPTCPGGERGLSVDQRRRPGGRGRQRGEDLAQLVTGRVHAESLRA